MFRRVFQNHAVQQFGKQVLTDMAQSAAEDAFSTATGIKPGRTGAPSLGELAYTVGKGAAQLHCQTEANRMQQQSQAQAQRLARQQVLIAQVRANAFKK